MTKDLSPHPPNLFVSPRCRQQAITKNAISYFLRETISGTRALRTDEAFLPRAHSIRGVSTSMTFVRNWSIKQVLHAATWKTNSTFASFYLWEVAYSVRGTIVNHWVRLCQRDRSSTHLSTADRVRHNYFDPL